MYYYIIIIEILASRIHGGIGGIPGGILPRIGRIPTRIMACLRWDPAWDPTQDWRDPRWDPTQGVQ